MADVITRALLSGFAIAERDGRAYALLPWDAVREFEYGIGVPEEGDVAVYRKRDEDVTFGANLVSMFLLEGRFDIPANEAYLDRWVQRKEKELPSRFIFQLNGHAKNLLPMVHRNQLVQQRGEEYLTMIEGFESMGARARGRAQHEAVGYLCNLAPFEADADFSQKRRTIERIVYPLLFDAGDIYAAKAVTAVTRIRPSAAAPGMAEALRNGMRALLQDGRSEALEGYLRFVDETLGVSLKPASEYDALQAGYRRALERSGVWDAKALHKLTDIPFQQSSKEAYNAVQNGYVHAFKTGLFEAARSARSFSGIEVDAGFEGMGEAAREGMGHGLYEAKRIMEISGVLPADYFARRA